MMTRKRTVSKMFQFTFPINEGTEEEFLYLRKFSLFFRTMREGVGAVLRINEIFGPKGVDVEGDIEELLEQKVLKIGMVKERVYGVFGSYPTSERNGGKQLFPPDKKLLIQYLTSGFGDTELENEAAESILFYLFEKDRNLRTLVPQCHLEQQKAEQPPKLPHGMTSHAIVLDKENKILIVEFTPSNPNNSICRAIPFRRNDPSLNRIDEMNRFLGTRIFESGYKLPAPISIGIYETRVESGKSTLNFLYLYELEDSVPPVNGASWREIDSDDGDLTTISKELIGMFSKYAENQQFQSILD